jgi:hypothetical protein
MVIGFDCFPRRDKSTVLEFHPFPRRDKSAVIGFDCFPRRDKSTSLQAQTFMTNIIVPITIHPCRDAIDYVEMLCIRRSQSSISSRLIYRVPKATTPTDRNSIAPIA